MKRLVILGLLASSGTPALAETIFEKRLQVLENQVGGFFSEDPVGHAETSLADNRDLKAALIEKKLAEVEALQIELIGLDAQMLRLDPAYQPAPVPGVNSICEKTSESLPEVQPIAISGPITSCVLGSPGCE